MTNFIPFARGEYARKRSEHRYAVGDTLKTKGGASITVVELRWYRYIQHPLMPAYAVSGHKNPFIFDYEVW